MSIDEDYYKPIITNSAFNNDYIQYDSEGNKGKILTINEYLDMIRPYLSNTINDHKNQGEWKIHSANITAEHKTEREWKIHLTLAINFIFSKEYSDKIRTMHTKSDNIEIMMGSETNEITEELFKFILQRYQEGLEESMRGGEFIFDYANLLYHNLNATINPKNNDDKSIQYPLTVACIKF